MKPDSAAKVQAHSASQPPADDVPSVTPLDSDQEALSTGQRVAVLLPEQKEGSILTVRDDGTIEVPTLGAVQAAGKRPSDVEKAIAVEFLDRYIATLVGAVRVSNVPPR